MATEALEVLLPLGRTREAPWAYGTRSQLCMVVDDLEGTVGSGTKAIELAKRLGDTGTLVVLRLTAWGRNARRRLAGGWREAERSLLGF